MNIPRPFAVLAVAGTLAVAVPTGLAHAASVQPRANGVFHFLIPDGGYVMFGPASDTCLPMDPGATFADNDTDNYATLYADARCQESVETIPPGSSREVSAPSVLSVKFTR